MHKITIPPSKSLSNRVLLMGLYQPFYLKNVLKSDDTKVMVEILKKLGVEIEITAEDAYAFDIKMMPGQREQSGERVELYVENAGTATRFITVALSFLPGKYRLYGNERMHDRPIGNLVMALHQLGAEVKYEGTEGHLPLLIDGKELGADGKRICTVDQRISSQYLSGLLLNAPFWPGRTIIARSGKMVSESYVDLTLGMLGVLGLKVEIDRVRNCFIVEGGQQAVKDEYIVEPDFSSASYWIARAAITGAEFLLKDLHLDSLQGDRLFLELLQKAGLGVKDTEAGIVLNGGSIELPTYVDCVDFPDATMTLAVLAAVTGHKMELSGIANLRVKECDRIAALVTELRKVGVWAEEKPDGLVVYGVEPDLLQVAKIETYNDHRMAMCFAVVRLVQPSIEILGAECVSKTYPTFWEDWGLVDKKD